MFPSRRRFLLASAVVPLVYGSHPAAYAARLAQAGKKTALAPADWAKVVEAGYAFLKSKQKDDGSFAPPRAGEPGVTALVGAALVRCGKDATDPVVAKAFQFLEASAKPDGGVYAQGFANYTTSLAVMAFKEANAGGKYDKQLAAAGKFLKTLQYGDDVSDSDPKYGGAGYGKKGERGGGADLSNTHFFTEALLAAGTSRDDAAIKRAVTFISRSQNLPGEFNALPYAAKVADEDKGGFVYSTAVGDKDDRKTPAGGLRSEGGMTYAGLKSFLYAGVGKDDPRVKAAVDWARRHYTLAENPGRGQAGLFYYYHVFAKALDAVGEDQFADAKGVKHDWRQELFDALKGRQRADGSWVNEKDRAYMESEPTLATAFALLALAYAKP